MADWDLPLQLIDWKEDGQIGLIEETITILRAINKPLVIPCIAGSCRTGKSFLMNRLCARRTGFPLGNTIQPKTKGLWVWYKKHPKDASKGLLLMDTEGLDDPEMGDENDANILCLSLLLSSTFIFNCIGRVDNIVIEKMDFVTEISNHVRIKSEVNVESNSDYYHLFPHFVLVCRDKLLDLEIDGEKVSADFCMERMMLTPNKKAATLRGRKRNETKLKLRKYFPKRKCFFLRRPVEKEDDMLRLEELPESELQKEFLTESDKFCSYVIDNSTVKNIENIDVDGEKFVQLVELYAEAINNDAIPCVSNAYDLFASLENEKLLIESVSKYKELMSQLRFPIESNEVNTWHLSSHQIVMDHFADKIFLVGENKHFAELQQKLCSEFSGYFDRNNEISAEVCNDILTNEFLPIRRKFEDGVYDTRKGFHDFMKDWFQVKVKYELASNKGAAAKVALHIHETHLLNYQKKLLHTIEATRRKEEEEKLRLKEVQIKLEVEREISKLIEERLAMILATQEKEASIFKHACGQKLEESEWKIQELYWIRKKESNRLLYENLNAEVRQLETEIEAAKQEREKEKQEMRKSLKEQDNQMEEEHLLMEKLRKELEKARLEESQDQGFVDSILDRAFKNNEVIAHGLDLVKSKNMFNVYWGTIVCSVGVARNLLFTTKD